MDGIARMGRDDLKPIDWVYGWAVHFIARSHPSERQPDEEGDGPQCEQESNEREPHGDLSLVQRISASKARLSCKTLTRRSPKKPSWRASVCWTTNVLTVFSLSALARATRFT